MRPATHLPALAAALLLTAASAIAHADAARGRTLYDSRCVGCHSPDAHRVGPAHRGVVGRKAGGAKDYDYSPALKASTLVWDVALLQKWLADPEALIPGQRMGFSVDEAKDRVDLADYLATLR